MLWKGMEGDGTLWNDYISIEAYVIILEHSRDPWNSREGNVAVWEIVAIKGNNAKKNRVR